MRLRVTTAEGAGYPVEQAEVRLLRNRSGSRTDRKGEVTFTRLASGEDSVVVTRLGHHTARAAVRLAVGRTSEITVTFAIPARSSRPAKGGG